MTKREICERLMNIHNRLFHEYSLADGIEDIDLEAIGKDIGSLILDLAVPVEEKKEGRNIWSWYDCPGRDQNGRKCDKTDCRSCPFRPANTIPACDWPPVESDHHFAEGGKKVIEKIVDPTGKNPTSYKCPFCNSYTITKTYRDIAGYLDGTCDHCGRTFTLTEEGKI